MRAANHGSAAALFVIAVMLTAGCSESAEEPIGLATTDPAATSPASTDEPDPTATPTPTPTRTVPPALRELRAMELPPGLVIENIPEVEGAELAALDAFVRFHAARWRSLLDSEVSAELDSLASESVVEGVADQVEVQREEGFHLGGTVSFDVTVDGASDNVAVVSACFDQSEVTVVRDGNEEVGEDAAANPVGRLIADVTNTGAGWMVSDSRVEFDGC